MSEPKKPSNVVPIQQKTYVQQIKIFVGKRNQVEDWFNKWSILNAGKVNVEDFKGNYMETKVYVIIVLYGTEDVEAITDVPDPNKQAASPTGMQGLPR